VVFGPQMNPAPARTIAAPPAQVAATSAPGACVSCGALGVGRFCPSCGQGRTDGRHTLRRFGHWALASVVGEKGLVNTAVHLTARPGRVMTDYLAGRTIRYVNPVGYLLVTAALFTLVGRLIGGSTGAAESDRLIALLAVPFVAAAARVLYWRGPYNLAEHLIIVTYLGAHMLALLTMFYLGVLVVPAAGIAAYAALSLGAGLVYYGWGYSQVFPLPRYLGVLLAVMSVALGSAIWVAAMAALVGVLRGLTT
jgi:hypothetical protein